jgi:hypothetical protein
MVWVTQNGTPGPAPERRFSLEKAFKVNGCENQQWATVTDLTVSSFSWKLKWHNSIKASVERPCACTMVIIQH